MLVAVRRRCYWSRIVPGTVDAGGGGTISAEVVVLYEGRTPDFVEFGNRKVDRMRASQCRQHPLMSLCVLARHHNSKYPGFNPSPRFLANVINQSVLFCG